MKARLSEAVQDAFDTNNVRTLQQLYKMVENDKELKIKPDVLKHRVRSCIWGLKKSNKIKRLGYSKYKKISHF